MIAVRQRASAFALLAMAILFAGFAMPAQAKQREYLQLFVSEPFLELRTDRKSVV